MTKGSLEVSVSPVLDCMNEYRHSGRTGRKNEARSLERSAQIHGALLQNNKLIECLRTEIEEEATKGHVVVKLFLQRGSH